MAILEEGQLLIITGHMGSGKTYLGTVITEEASKTDYDIYTNVNFFKQENWEKAKNMNLLDKSVDYVVPPQNVHIINTMSFLLKNLTKTPNNIVILDEAMIYAGYDRHGSKILRWFKDFVVQCRKMNTCVILITQVKSQLARLLREQLEHYEAFCYKKRGHYMVKLFKYMPPEHDGTLTPPTHGPAMRQTIITTFPYDTKAPASLVMDVDMENFLGDISYFDSIELRDNIDKVVDEWTIEKKRPKKKEKKKKTMRQRIKEMLIENPNLQWEDVAKQIPGLKRDYFYRLKQEFGVYS